MLRSWFAPLMSVSSHAPVHALTCFFTHHIGFGCFVSLFPCYVIHTHLVQCFFPSKASRIPSTLQRNDLYMYNNDCGSPLPEELARPRK